MPYTLDVTMEKLLHSLQELIMFRRKFINIVVDKDSPELAILNDAIFDLSFAIALYIKHKDPEDLAKKVIGCRYTYDLAMIFKEENLINFLITPYFSQSDLNEINRKGG